MHYVPLSTRTLAATIFALLLFSLGIVSFVGGISPTALAQQTPQQTPQPTSSKPILITDPVPDPKQEGVQWFSPTGHTLRARAETR